MSKPCVDIGILTIENSIYYKTKLHVKEIQSKLIIEIALHF